MQKDHDALEGFEKVTEIRYSVGKAAQQDVLRAQLEVTRLAQRAAMLTQQRRTLEAQLNSLRNVPIDSPVGAPATVQPSAFVYTQDQLQEAAQANYPVLKQRQTMVEQGRLSVDLARKEERPDFSVGYTYMQRDGLAGYVWNYPHHFSAHLSPPQAGHGDCGGGGQLWNPRGRCRRMNSPCFATRCNRISWKFRRRNNF